MSKIGLQGFKGCPRFSSPVVMDSKRQQDKLKKERRNKLKEEQQEKPKDVSDVRQLTSDKRVTREWVVNVRKKIHDKITPAGFSVDDWIQEVLTELGVEVEDE